jgi:enamine deaminase RidA (YjgF/YER057c/UK114 family)
MMERTSASSPHLTFEGMSQVVRAGPWAFTSGQVALGSDGDIVGVGDARTQADQCFDNVELALGEAGLALHDVVKLTCFLTSAAHFAGYAEAKRERFQDESAPASTAVVVTALLDERLLLEVEAVAVVSTLDH